MQNSKRQRRVAVCILHFAFCISLSCATTPPAVAPAQPVVATPVAPAAPATPTAPAAPVANPSQSLAQAITAIINGPGVSRGAWGIAVQSLTRNDRLFEHNPRTFLVPASIAKLVAVAAAVDAAGWDYRFETTLRATGPVVNGVLQGDLLVVGSGDPSIGGRAGDDLTKWVDALKAAGIRTIDGRIIGDDNTLDDPRPGAMWSWDDLAYGYGALFGALNYAENRLAVTVTPGRTAGAPMTLSVEPHAATRPLGNRAVTGAPGSPPLIWAEQRPGEPFLTIAGSLPAGSGATRLSVSAGNPTIWFAAVLRNRLQRDGIDVTGEAFDIDDVQPPPDRTAATLLYTYRSHPLSEIAEPTLKNSIDMYAEALLRLIASVSGGRDNDAALAALAMRLPAWGLPAGAMQIVDGSGLSRRDALPAEAIVPLLQRMYDQSGTSPWMRALPIAGRDGTLENRMKGTAAEGNVAAKTGTMSNIRTLAGYVRTRDGEPLAFVIMVNNFEGTGAQAQAAIDAIAVRLAEFSR
jgi:serine-type D-Ala-D-Ala carboxypeptidase/endopeptidase (penicillin-binding protein 4)